jgi:hypothetical protein
MVRATFASFSVLASDEWLDVTDADSPDQPPTLAREDGVGALQFSVATFRAGKLPEPETGELLSMLREFATSQKLGEPTEVVTESQPVRLAAGSMRDGPWFIRTWYVSDGRNFALITYTCNWQEHQSQLVIELAECERIVRSIQFIPAS